MASGETLSKEQAVERYLHLTRVEMPRLAKSGARRWPVQEDHCFQRIVLDAICGGRWYDHLQRPAYKHLTEAQAKEAVELCERLIAGEADIVEYNRRSLAWRGKLRG